MLDFVVGAQDIYNFKSTTGVTYICLNFVHLLLMHCIGDFHAVVRTCEEPRGPDSSTVYDTEEVHVCPA